MKKIAVFDLDGTLSHTAPTLAVAMNIFLREEGREEIPLPLMEDFLGNGATVLLKKAYTYLGVPSEELDIDRARMGFFAAYERTYLGAELYEGMEKTVADLRREGLLVGVLSNKPHKFVPPLMKKLLPDIDFAFTVGQTERPRKPDPTVLLELIDKAGSSKENCIYIGDSDVDIKTARNAGVKAVAVSWGYRKRAVLEELEPDAIADTWEELYEILMNFISE